MRVAHFMLGRCNPESTNGVDKTVFYLSKAQAGLGHEVAVFSLTEKTAIPIPGVDVRTSAPISVPFVSSGSPLEDLARRVSFHVPESMVSELFSWRPEVLHLHSVHNSQNIALARRAGFQRIPYCVTTHGGLSPTARLRNRWLKMGFRFLFEQRYLEQAAFLHAISSEDVEGIRTYGVRNEIVIAPNGIDADVLPAETDAGALTRRYPALIGRRIFMFVGRLDPVQKGLDLLLRAFAEAQPLNAVLVLVGPDWRSRRADLESLVEHLDLTEHAVFTGPAYGQEKYDFLAAADVFVHPSRWEAGAPFSVLEAAAAGRALLVTSHADPSRFVERWEAGVTADLDVESLASGISSLAAASPARLGAMGRKAAHAIEVEFGWRPTADRLLDAYAAHTL